MFSLSSYDRILAICISKHEWLSPQIYFLSSTRRHRSQWHQEQKVEVMAVMMIQLIQG